MQQRDSDQLGHLSSLFKDFIVHVKKAKVYSFPLSRYSGGSDQTGLMPRLTLIIDVVDHCWFSYGDAQLCYFQQDFT